MPKIIIGSDVINFPNSGTDALWSPSVIQFAEVVADTFSKIVSPYDVSPQVQNLTTDTNVNLELVSVEFPNFIVRQFTFNYAIYRTREDASLTVIESGTVNGIYNTSSASWSIEDSYIGDRQPDGSSYHSFSMLADKLVLNTVAIGAPYDSANSKISYSAKTLLVDNL
jgi:hypothetical protein